MARWFGFGSLFLSVLGFCLRPTAVGGEEKDEKKTQDNAGEKDQKNKDQKQKDQKQKDEKRKQWGEKKRTKKKQPSGWVVLQVGNDLIVVQGEKIPEVRKLLEKDNEKAAKAAKASARKFEPKKLVVVKEGFSNQKEADKFAEKYKEELKAKKKAEKEKKDTEPKKKVPDRDVEL